MIEKYRNVIEKDNGCLHRCEDWGRRQLAFDIAKVHKAHYVLMNIECSQSTLDEIRNMFKFSDAVLRNLVIKRKQAITSPSLMMEASDDTPVSSSTTVDSDVVAPKNDVKQDRDNTKLGESE